MNIEEIERRLATAGIALLPHQRRAVDSRASIVLLSGGVAAGKTFTVLPWMLSRDPRGDHAVLTRSADRLIAAAKGWLDALSIECFVDRRRGPIQWDTLTIRGGASVIFARLGGEHRGYRFNTAFIDSATHFNESYSDVATAAKRADRTLITTYGGYAMEAALHGNREHRSIEIVDAAAVHVNHRLAGERVANA